MRHFVRECRRSTELSQGSPVLERPAETPFYGQFRPTNDRNGLTEDTFPYVHRNQAVTPLSPGALGRNDNKGSLGRGQQKGPLSLFLKHLRHNREDRHQNNR